MTAKKSRRRGVVLSLTGQQKLETARRQIEKAERYGDRLTLDEFSLSVGFSFFGTVMPIIWQISPIGY